MVTFSSNSNEPIDIWNIEKKIKNKENNKANSQNDTNKINSTQLIKSK